MRSAFATFWCLFLASPSVAGPREAQASALEDARTLAQEDCLQTRYLWQPGGFADDQLNALTVHVNRLSRRAKLKAPRRVAADLVAVELDWYAWDPYVYGRLATVDPYFTVQVEVLNEKNKRVQKSVPAPWLDPGTVVELQQRTGSRIPVVRADWFLVQSVRQLSIRNTQTGVGYYDWLEIRNRKDLEKFVRLDTRASDELDRHMRAVLERSGVAQHGRQVVRYQSYVGAYYMTLDTKEWSQKNLQTELLKPGVFSHDAEEIFAAAPNGLWYYGLFANDKDGTRQDSAPDFIGSDDSPLRTGRDGRIHVGLSCIRCHVEDGLRPINDWARNTFTGRVELVSPFRVERNEFARLYLSPLELQMFRDRQVYAAALAELGGEKWTAGKDAAALSAFYDSYVERPLDVKQIELETGIKDLAEKLKAAKNLPLSLAPLLRQGGTIRRELAEDFTPFLHMSL